MKGKSYKTKPIKNKDWDELNFSQSKVNGFDLGKSQNAKILMIGGGGIGSLVVLGLVKKGSGLIHILDDDFVELKNNTRQLFGIEDVGKNKAIQLAKRASREGFFKTEIIGFPYRFQEMEEKGWDFNQYDTIICGVDNNPTRVSVSKVGIKENISIIHAAVSRDGNSLYCAIQEAGKACFGCMFPHSINDESYPCNLPGIIDVNQVVSGFIVYAVDTILSGRHREWNIKSISLDGSMPDSSLRIERKEDCLLCGKNYRI